MESNNIPIEKEDSSTKSECLELKNIKYQTMLLNGSENIVPSSGKININNLEHLLDQERNVDKKVAWNKLDKSIKTKKIMEYIQHLIHIKKLKKEDYKSVELSLLGYLDKKLLQKAKDINYNKNTGKIEDIPCLEYNQNTKRFTLKRNSHSHISLSNGKTRKKNDKIDKNKD